MNFKFKLQNKNQAEIFGIALLFVVLVIGFLVYSQFSSIKNRQENDLQKEKEYKILAESTLNTILKMSVGCQQSMGDDSLKSLINYCLSNSYSDFSAKINCYNVGEVDSCDFAIFKIKSTLNQIYNQTEFLDNKKFFMIPYELKISLPSDKNTPFSNLTISNFGQVRVKNKIINSSNRKSLGFKKAPSGFFTFATSKRNLDFEFFLYYR